MNDETWNPPGSDPANPAPTVDAPTDTAFRGRTPGRGSALRAGIGVGSALVVAVGAAVVLGASPPSSAGVGAQPSPAASTAPGDQQAPNANGNGRGFGFGRGGFGLGPSAVDPFTAGGPGKLRNGAGPFGGERGAARFGGVKVTAVSGTSISLATEDGWTRTITVTPDTKVTRGGQPATAADVKVGDMVRFAERRNSDGTYTITALAIVLPRTAGTVTAVGSDTVTITRRDGTTETIRTTASTTYHVGRANGSRSDVKVGSIIAAVGERGADGSLSASSIEVVLPRVAGTVTAVTADSVTISRRNGTTVTIHVGAGTTIGVAGVDTAKLSDVKVGMALIATGTQRSDGSLDATAIRAGQGGKLRPNPKTPQAAPGSSASPTSGNG